jgi:uncharacterized protein (DUF885 family)
MLKNTCKFRYVFLCFLLSVSFLCSCARSSPQQSGDYETYTASKSDSAPSPAAPAPDSPQAQKARMDFDTLCGKLFHDQLSENYLTLHYTLADPSAYGITDCGLDFGDFSLDLLKEAGESQKEDKAALDKIPVELLDQQQQLTYKILEATYEAEEMFDGLELYYQPLAPTVGIQAQLPVLLAEYIFYSKQDVEDYLNLLSTIDGYYGQILEFEKEKAKAGLFMTDSCVDTIVSDCGAYLVAPEENFLTSTFDERIDAMTDLGEEEKAAYKARNLEVLANHFIPAYETLLNGLKELKGTCTNEMGLCYHPKGKEYYEYLVHSSTGTTYETIDDLKDAVEKQLNYDLMAMSKLLMDHEELGEQLDNYQFSYTDPNEILEHLRTAIAADFPELEHTSYTTKYVPASLEQTLSPAFFLVPPMDRYKDCVIYINQGSVSTSGDLYTTLAHEGYPGHLYQNVYFLGNCDSPLRKILSFSSYSEGWATYVENYAYTMDNGLSKELGSLLAHNASASLALHALLDININYYGWDKDQVASYLSQYYDVSDHTVVDQIYGYMLDAPVNYLNYYVGYLEILRMKEQAEKTLKDRFQLKEFNRFLLDMGPAPFTVIKPYFKEWLNASKG